MKKRREQSRIKQALADVAVDPYNAGKPRHPSDFWSTRTGDYHAIYEINQQQNQVVVLFVGRRKKVNENFIKML